MHIGMIVAPAKPDGYHLEGVIIGIPNADRPYYSVNFECADGQIENVWLEESDIVPYAEGVMRELLAAAEQAHRALLDRKPHSVPGGEQACEALFQAIERAHKVIRAPATPDAER